MSSMDTLKAYEELMAENGYDPTKAQLYLEPLVVSLHKTRDTGVIMSSEVVKRDALCQAIAVMMEDYRLPPMESLQRIWWTLNLPNFGGFEVSEKDFREAMTAVFSMIVVKVKLDK